MDIIVPENMDFTYPDVLLDDEDARNACINLARLRHAYRTYCICKLEGDTDEEIRKRVQEALEW